MKLNPKLLLALLAVSISPVLAADGTDHKDHAGEHEKKAAGPNGGRIITAGDLKYEFFVLPDRKVKITFLDKDNKAEPVKEQAVTATGGDRSAPVKMAFAKSGDALVSDKAFPEGASLPIVVQVKVTPEAKAATEKFSVNTASCPTCSHAEYACTCDH